MCAHRAVAPLVDDHPIHRVSSAQGWLEIGFALPPHRSTTLSPSRVMDSEAPISPLSWKFFTNSPATRSNCGSQNPATSPVLTLVLTMEKLAINRPSFVSFANTSLGAILHCRPSAMSLVHRPRRH